MSDVRAGTDQHSTEGRKEDIDSKIADFMADIDEIVLGKKTNHHLQEDSEWKQCFDETSQAIYYWNSKTNECSWDPPPTTSANHLPDSTLTTRVVDEETRKRRQPSSSDLNSPKKLKKPSLIAEYTSSESESSQGDDDEENIDELLEEVLEKDEKIDKNKPSSVDLYPLFEADCRAAIARLTDLGDETAEICTLRVRLETRLEDCLAGHLPKAYAASKLDEALGQIEEFEKLYLTTAPIPMVAESVKSSLTSSEMALLLSLPPPPPPSSPPPPSIFPQPLSGQDDTTLQLFYAQLNYDQTEPPAPPSIFDAIKAEQHHPHHHHHKDKKSKPAKTLPTDLIQKWTHARQELRGIADTDDS